jgi:hypothetical protein
MSMVFDFLKFSALVLAGVVAFGLIVAMVWGLVAEDEDSDETDTRNLL